MHPCFFSAVTTSRTSFQIASECTIHCPWFLNVLSCSKFWKNLFLLSSECIFYCPCFQHFLIRFNFQKHCSKCARMHLLVFLVSKLSQQCQLWLYVSALGNEQTYCHLWIHICLVLFIVDHIDWTVTQSDQMNVCIIVFKCISKHCHLSMLLQIKSLYLPQPPEWSPWNENIATQKCFFWNLLINYPG